MEPPPAGPKQGKTPFADRMAILLRTQGLSAKRAADQEGLHKSTLKRWRRENRNEKASSVEAIPEGEQRQYWSRLKYFDQMHLALIYHGARFAYVGLFNAMPAKLRLPGHLWLYVPLRRTYDNEISTKGQPPNRQWLQEQAERLHQGQPGCSCGKEKWRPSNNWMRTWYAAQLQEVGAGLGI